MIQVRTLCSLNKDHQHPRWQPQKTWTLFQDYRDAQEMQQMQYLLIPRSKWKMHPLYWKFYSQNVLIFGYVYRNTNGQNHGRKLRKKFQIENAYSYTVKKDYSCLCMYHIKLFGKKQNINPTWKILMKDVDLGEPTSFLDHVYLSCTQRECQICKDIVDNYRSMFESRISARATEKLPETKATVKPDAETISSLVLWHGRPCKEMCGRYCEFANKTTEQYFQGRGAMHGRSSTLKHKKMNRLEIFLLFASKLTLKCLYLAGIGGPWYFLDLLTNLARAATKWTKACDIRLAHLISWIDQTCHYVPISWMWKHSTTLHIRIVSRLWFRRRPWRLDSQAWGGFLCIFGCQTFVRSKLDVQETHICFTRFYRSWGDFSRHQSGSDQNWSRSIKRKTCWFQCFVVCLWGYWSLD